MTQEIESVKPATSVIIDEVALFSAFSQLSIDKRYVVGIRRSANSADLSYRMINFLNERGVKEVCLLALNDADEREFVIHER